MNNDHDIEYVHDIMNAEIPDCTTCEYATQCDMIIGDCIDHGMLSVYDRNTDTHRIVVNA